MAYERPINKSQIPPQDKPVLLKEYFEHYRAQYEKNPSAETLNAKLPRSAFGDLFDEIGKMLLAKSESLASIEGPVGTFLNENPLPEPIDQRLTRQYRVFCLALNALKQWVAAEQSATDRYLLGGTSRNLCRAAASICLVTKVSLGSDCELHHPVRDGRPAIPLSKIGHRSIEGQVAPESDDSIGPVLSQLRRNGHRSWTQLRQGCQDLIGQPEFGQSQRRTANNRAFAKKAAIEADTGYQEILDWLDENGL